MVEELEEVGGLVHRKVVDDGRLDHVIELLRVQGRADILPVCVCVCGVCVCGVCVYGLAIFVQVR